MAKMISDIDRLNWIENELSVAGGGIISDDNGHWAVVTDGFQNVACGSEPIDIETVFWVEKKRWHKSIREAIDSCILEKDDRFVDAPQEEKNDESTT